MVQTADIPEISVYQESLDLSLFLCCNYCDSLLDVRIVSTELQQSCRYQPQSPCEVDALALDPFKKCFDIPDITWQPNDGSYYRGGHG